MLAEALFGKRTDDTYGSDGDPAILVAQGTSREFNPELPQAVVDRALERDPLANRAEYLAEFRTDVESLLTIEAIQACVVPGVKERPPELKHGYVAFVDPSGGSSDSMTLAIAHKEGQTEILDLVRERKPPFSPEAVVEEFASTILKYRCAGDAPTAPSPPTSPDRPDISPSLSAPVSMANIAGSLSSQPTICSASPMPALKRKPS